MELCLYPPFLLPGVKICKETGEWVPGLQRTYSFSSPTDILGKRVPGPQRNYSLSSPTDILGKRLPVENGKPLYLQEELDIG